MHKKKYLIKGVAKWIKETLSKRFLIKESKPTTDRFRLFAAANQPKSKIKYLF